ncbi:WD40-repeat-containing domain protein [Xylaria nigripes]|nr:WD40-repeat-containing domain protein [Xylaria nigripes]
MRLAIPTHSHQPSAKLLKLRIILFCLDLTSAVNQVEVADQNPPFPTSYTRAAPDHLFTSQPPQTPSSISRPALNSASALSSRPDNSPRDSFLVTSQFPQEQEQEQDQEQDQEQVQEQNQEQEQDLEWQLDQAFAASHITRRRRLLSDDDISPISETSFSEPPVPGLPFPDSEPPRKRRKRSEVTMLANTDGSGTANGRPSSYANGKTSSHSSVASTQNGTHKSGSSKNTPSKPRSVEKYFGHDREEVTRLLIQALTDMGYHAAAQNVSQMSGYELENPTVASFRAAILEGNWVTAEELLDDSVPFDESKNNSNGLVLSNGADRSMMKFWIRQQKYLELLEQNNQGQALMVLRNELTSLYQNTQKLHFLSGLIMCESQEDLRSKADWDGVDGQSRHILLSELSKCISPSVMLPEHRLAVLLHQVKESQITGCYWHSSAVAPSLYSDHTCNKADFPTETVIELDDHAGEVWQVAFSHDGTKLASCGGDKQVIVWEVPSFKILHFFTEHTEGVGNFAWSWDDSMIVSCCRDKHARLYSVETGKCLRTLSRTEEPVTSCVWAPDNKSFIIGSLDKNGGGIVQWSLSGERIYNWKGPGRVEELAISPDGRWLVAKDCARCLHVYNFGTRELEYKMDLRVALASLSISQDSRHLLVNQTNGCAQLIDLVRRTPVQQYTGHAGGIYIIRASLGGAHENFVASGSEDGYVHIWHKVTGHPIERLAAHSPRCNAVAWCPNNPRLFATGGDDGKVKIWSNDQWRWDQRTQQQQQNIANRSSNV